MPRFLACLRIGLAAAALVLLSDVRSSSAAPEKSNLGKAEGYPVAPALSRSREERYRAGSFSALDTLVPPAAWPPHRSRCHCRCQRRSGDASGTHLGAERDALFRGIVAHYGRC
ncbi:hypothetical protein FNL55_11760 [Tardiphaga sp. vice352]|nr:hypothetical protein FIU28_11345 [Tardiphaga sp. vice154]QDM26853.1 hypothetical protein FNL56_12630 [Tardiphaga sp. vice304]QDM31919.1 hypothetical protein FNL55_11760 [Tardiphaga sp. vice352]